MPISEYVTIGWAETQKSNLNDTLPFLFIINQNKYKFYHHFIICMHWFYKFQYFLRIQSWCSGTYQEKKSLELLYFKRILSYFWMRESGPQESYCIRRYLHCYKNEIFNFGYWRKTELDLILFLGTAQKFDLND